MSEIHTYAGELDNNLICVRCIVGSAQWAAENLGGIWADSPTKIGVGWTFSETEGWLPPVQPEPEEMVEQWEL